MRLGGDGSVAKPKRLGCVTRLRSGPGRAAPPRGAARVPCVSTQTFVSHGQNREDVVLWRALNAVGVGRYVEIGGNDPEVDSISRAFYDAGWSGLVVEPEPAFASRYREQRPRDTVIEAAVTSAEGEVTLHRFPETGLSTLVDDIGEEHLRAGFEGVELTVPAVRLDALVAEHRLAEGETHFLVVDVEGAEGDVLSTVDLTAWRPWVLVVESTRPNSTVSTHAEWEPAVVAAGYEFCLFDGVSRFYVASERAEQLRAALSYPACGLDDFVSSSLNGLIGRVAGLEAEVLRWRRAALETWATAVAESHMAAAQQLMKARARSAELQKRVKALRARNTELAERVQELQRRQYGRRVARAAARRLR